MGGAPAHWQLPTPGGPPIQDRAPTSPRPQLRSMCAPWWGSSIQGGTGGSLLLQPGGLLGARGLELDVELLEGLLKLLLVPGKVRRDGVVEQQQLLVHHLDLGERRGSQLGGGLTPPQQHRKGVGKPFEPPPSATAPPRTAHSTLDSCP